MTPRGVRRLRVRHGSIGCFHSAGCTIVRNGSRAAASAIAESESGVPNRVRRNVVSGAPGAAIAVDRTDTTSITRNVVRDSAVGIETSHAADLLIAAQPDRATTTATASSGSFGSAAAIVRNVIATNGGDGISLRTWGGETLIARQPRARKPRQRDPGAVVAHWRVSAQSRRPERRDRDRDRRRGRATRSLARNRACGNGGLGIDAAAGVADGGGNRARATASPPSARVSSAPDPGLTRVTLRVSRGRREGG